MAEGSKDEDEEEPKGFAGLSSLVSNIGITPPSARKPRHYSSARLAAATEADETEVEGEVYDPILITWRPQNQGSDKPDGCDEQQSCSAPSGQSSKRPTGKWLLGIAAGVCVFWFLVSNQKAPPTAPTYTPTIRDPFARSQAQSLPREIKPSIGTNLILSTAQVTYCLAEDIRMDGAKSTFNSQSDLEVDRFNAMVADYNGRCGSFRYRSGTLEGARYRIEPYRSQLQTQGRSRFARSTPSDVPPKPVVIDLGPLRPPGPSTTASSPAPDATVKSIQRKLNELGYQAGNADGLMGKATRSAIKVFQRDSGFPDDGHADAALLIQLQANEKARRYSGATRERFDSSPKTSRTPANAYVSGPNWYCNEGYRKVGQTCEVLIVPTNAYVLGSNWYCNDGYRKVRETCEALIVPANAYVLGSNWYCNDGYRKVRETCEALDVPANAYVLGSNWYCNDGYRRVGDQCNSIFD